MLDFLPTVYSYPLMYVVQHICILSWEGSPACHVLQRAIRLESLRQEVQVEVGHGAGGEPGGVGQEDLHQRGRPLLLQGAWRGTVINNII